jgi:putative two-component system response regulator
MEAIIPIVLYHHENWDGNGYPTGLAGEAIPFEARLLSVADRYDALTSERPYRKGMTWPEVRVWLEGQMGSGLDPGIVPAFVEFFEQGKISSTSLTLTTGAA